jgi:hypothetical protein
VETIGITSTATAACERAAVADQMSFDHPIDVMFLIHKALSADAWRTEAIAEHLKIGEDFQSFRHSFHSWIQALSFHADMEDVYMTPRLPKSPQAQDNEAAHARLAQRIEEIQTYLEAIGHQTVTARTRRQLFGKVVALRIDQDDHLEEEEEFILPIIRTSISPEEQLEMVAHLLLNLHAPEQTSNWVLDWLMQDLTDVERRSLAKLITHLHQVESRTVAAYPGGHADGEA